MKKQIVLFAAILVLMSLASTASAALLNIDINGFDGVSQTPVTYTGTGAAGGGTWNAYTVVGLQNPAPSANLVTSTGASTSVRFDLDLCQGGTMEGSPWASGNNLMDDLVVVGTGGDVPTSVNFTLTGLAAGGSYDLYLYGLQGGVPSTYAGTAFTIGGVLAGYLYNPDSFIYVGGAFVAPQPLAVNRDYVLVSGLTADGSGTITGLLSSLTGVAALNGLQIVGTIPVPEPGTIYMTCAGILGLLAYAWRRQR